jgi:hypothetical protein
MSRSISPKLIRAMQWRAARLAAGASATRHQGKGAAKAAREYLCRLDLRQFAVSRPTVFQKRLNRATEKLASTLPPAARSWGLARKLMNIFLRDVFYTTYLSSHFHLEKLESLLEIPLDSITADQLRADAGPRVLPRWKGVKHLTSAISDPYQNHATTIAERTGVARVHLDTFWWGERRASRNHTAGRMGGRVARS